MKKANQNSQIVIYKSPSGETKIDVRFDGDTVWLTQNALAELFEKGRSTVAEHIQHIFTEGELEEDSVCREFRRTGTDGKEYLVKYYNLYLIIAVGYRVKSPQGTAFRQWATARPSEYIIKGFVMDDERLKTPNYTFGQDYFGNYERKLRKYLKLRKKLRKYLEITKVPGTFSALKTFSPLSPNR